LLSLFVQSSSSSDTGALVAAWVSLIVVFALIVLVFVGYWRLFTKIGLPGWMGIVPFVNVYMIFKARGQHDPLLWLILCVIPCISIVGLWVLASDTAEIFGKGIGWKIFLFLVPGLSHLVLGFGDASAVPSNIAPGIGLNDATS
jgi:hypothetical protein